MIPRTVTEEALARHKHERETADRSYNDALTALDQSVQALPEVPHPPPAPDEHQITPLNQRWNILAATRPVPTGWRGRLARFVLHLVEPMLTEQQAFNSALVDHINRNVPVAREIPRAFGSTLELVRQQAELAVRFQTRLIMFAQTVTPFVDSKDYEFHQISRRINEDALEATARVGHRLGELIQNESPFLLGRVEDAEHLARGMAAGLEGLSDEMLKRFESSSTRLQRSESGLQELSGAMSAVQQLAHSLRRDLERRPVEAYAGGVSARETSSPPSATAVAGGAQQMLASDPVQSHQYVGFEDLYRGSEVDIQGRMIDYVQLFAGASDVLDIGCGRGEFLKLLHQHGVSARGIDLNHEMVARCQADGLDVTEADALGYLRSLPDESLGGLIATQVVEHLPPDYLLRLLSTAFDKLRPGGRIVLETINPASWAAFFDSYIRDLTHMRPVHPDTLKYLVTASGFADAAVSWRSPYPEESKLRPLGAELRAAGSDDPDWAALADTFDHNVARLNGLMFTFMDYAVHARRP